MPTTTTHTATACAAVDNPQMPDSAVSTPPNSKAPPATVRTWREALRLYLQPASLRMLALGFAAGLPLLLLCVGACANSWVGSLEEGWRVERGLLEGGLLEGGCVGSGGGHDSALASRSASSQ